MTRSRKHVPVVIVGTPQCKKQANRKVRHYKELGQHSFYKRVFNSYSIKDYVWIDYDKRELKNNKEFRRIAKIIRNIKKGKLKASDYNLSEFLTILKETSNSFRYICK